MTNTDLIIQVGGKKKSRKQKRRRQRNGGSLLLNLGVPASLFAATQYMKKRSKKYGKRYGSYKSKKSYRKRRR